MKTFRFAILFMINMHGRLLADVPNPAPLPELDRIATQHARQRADAITKLNGATIKALEALKAQYLRAANLDAANRVQAKIEDLNREVAEAAPSATPPIGGGIGGVYTVKQKGRAGWPQYTRGNTYELDVAKVSGRTMITAEVEKLNKSSNGEVRLRSGDSSVLIGQWNREATQNGRLIFNASQHVTRPGKYVIEFKYTDGEDSLNIASVTIDTRSE